MSERKTFYDIHCHAFNLSHAGLLAFLNRFLKNNALTFSKIISGEFIKIIFKQIINQNPRLKSLLYLAFQIAVFLLAAAACYRIIFLNDRIFPGIVKSFVAVLGILAIIAFLAGFIWWRISKKSGFLGTIKKIVNLLSVVENDTSSMFLYMEKDFLSMDKEIKELMKSFPGNMEKVRDAWGKKKKKNMEITIDGKVYDKVILTPLLMDFGYKGFKKEDIKEIYYNNPPRKPVVEQVVDMFNGIQDYMARSPFRIFEIYPFLGINTENYELGITRTVSNDIGDTLARSVKNKASYIKQTGKLVIYNEITPEEEKKWINCFNVEKDKPTIKMISEIVKESKKEDVKEKTNIPKMLARYFGGYTGNYKTFFETYTKCFGNNEKDAIKKHGISIENIENIKNHFFAGIKLYPPLGFDPWPDPDKVAADKRERAGAEFDKVNYLYQFCQEKGIPITVHCLNGGFVVDDNYLKNTNPDKWEEVLSRYKDLKINFAHCGIDDTLSIAKLSQWTETVFALIKNNKNVYGDFAIVAKNKEFYKPFLEWVGKSMIENRILFGSDFPMLLFNNDSYYEYLTNYFGSGINLIDKFCTENPRSFLFK